MTDSTPAPRPIALPAWVLVEAGDVFEGTPEQFDDCFFAADLTDGRVFISQAADWADFNKYSITFLGQVPAEFA